MIAPPDFLFLLINKRCNLRCQHCDFWKLDCESAVCSASSGTASTSPAPNTGVGMRKMTLLAATAAAKSGCAMAQPGASARPVMTKRSCTPPSGVPSGFFTKRASRTGPLSVMNDGILFFAPFNVATAICGLTAGLVPPTAGWRWQPEH